MRADSDLFLFEIMFPVLCPYTLHRRKLLLQYFWFLSYKMCNKCQRLATNNVVLSLPRAAPSNSTLESPLLGLPIVKQENDIPLKCIKFRPY